MNTPTDPSRTSRGAHLLTTLLLCDARLPVGGHTQSAGLEPAIMASLTAADVPHFITARLQTVTTTDAALVALTMRSLHSHGGRDELTELATWWAASTAHHATRTASTALGQSYARLIRSMWPNHAYTTELRTVAKPPRALCVAIAAAILELPIRDAVTAVVYDDIQSITSAALKLLPLDPVDTVRWTLGACEIAEDTIDTAMAVTETTALPCISLPLVDDWISTHHSAKVRLFRA